MLPHMSPHKSPHMSPVWKDSDTSRSTCCRVLSHWRHVRRLVADAFSSARQFHSPEVAAARRLVGAHVASVKGLGNKSAHMSSNKLLVWTVPLKYMASNKLSDLCGDMCGNMSPVWKHYYVTQKSNMASSDVRVKNCWCCCGCRIERAEVSRSDAEADQPGEAAWTVQDGTGAGDLQLQGGGDQTAQDHLPARERAWPLHQWGQRPHAEGIYHTVNQCFNSHWFVRSIVNIADLWG